MAKRRQAEKNAGAFYGPDGFTQIPVPMRTLSDDFHDEPAEPQDSDRVPEPEPPRLVKRLVDRLARRPDGDR